MGVRAVGGAVVAMLTLAPARPQAQPWAPEPPPTHRPAVRFRGDFRAGWNLVDGAGVLDHVVLEASFGPAFGPLGLAPLLAVGAGIAEGGEASLRVAGGIELDLPLHPVLSLVPSVFVGAFRAWEGDLRVGPAGRFSFALRVAGDRGFFIQFEPISLYVFPEPPGGATPYTAHVALDLTLLRFGGRTP